MPPAAAPSGPGLRLTRRLRGCRAELGAAGPAPPCARGTVSLGGLAVSDRMTRAPHAHFVGKPVTLPHPTGGAGRVRTAPVPGRGWELGVSESVTEGIGRNGAAGGSGATSRRAFREQQPECGFRDGGAARGAPRLPPLCGLRPLPLSRGHPGTSLSDSPALGPHPSSACEAGQHPARGVSVSLCGSTGATETRETTDARWSALCPARPMQLMSVRSNSHRV